MTLVPAYGRDYKSKAAVVADWEAGKDFMIASIGPDSGRYCSIRDSAQLPATVTIRYKRLTMIVLIRTGDT
jgi:hypothetical protein